MGIKILETVTAMYVFFLSFAPSKQDKLPEVRWKEDKENGFTRSPVKNQYFCGVRVLMDQCRAGIGVLTGQDYWSVMLHWNPKPITHTVYHHLLHRLTLEYWEQHHPQQKRRGEIKGEKRVSFLLRNFWVTEASNLQTNLQTPPIIFPQL